MKYYFLIAAFLLAFIVSPYGAEALSTFATVQGGTGTTTPSGLLYGDNGATNHLNTVTIGSNLTFSGGTLSATGGGSGVGTVATSSLETKGQIPYWTTTSGYPALVGSVATTSLTINSPLTTTGTAGALIGGSNLTINCQTASGSQAGCLSSTDWTTFNGKQGTLSVTWPITLSGATVGFNGLGTSTAAVIPNLAYFTGVNTFGNVATTSVTCSGSVSCTSFTAIGASPITLTGSGGANYWTSSAGTTYLNTNLIAGFPSFTATSTTATSSVTNALTVGKYLNVGAAPGYGFFPEDYIDVWNPSAANDLTAVNVGTAAVGACAQSMYVMNGDNLILNQDFTTLSNTNTGYVGGAGSACIIMSPLANPESTYLYQPTWDMDFVLGTTTQTVGTIPVGFKWSGNNGASPFMVLTNNGKLGIGTTSPSMGLLEVNGVGVFATSSVNAFSIGPNGTMNPAFSVNASSTNAKTGITIVSNFAGNGVQVNASSSGTNEALTINSKGTGAINVNSGSGGVNLQIGGTTRGSFLTNTISLQSIQNFSVSTNVALATAATVRQSFVSAPDTGLTAGQEAPEAYFNFNTTRQHASNTLIAIERGLRLTPSIESFATSGGVITNAAAMAIDGPPSGGTNTTISTSTGLFIASSTYTIANTTTGIGLYVEAPVGATNNYAAVLLGRVGVGTSSPTGTALSTNGTVYMTGLTGSSGLQTGIVCLDANNQLINESVACVASAERFKENIKPLDVGLDELMQLRPISFTWKKDYLGSKQSDPNQNSVQYSLVADEVQKVNPNLVSVTLATTTFEGVIYAPGTIQGLADQNHWTALFVKSIQEQQQEIKALQNKVTRSVELNWIWGMIGLFGLILMWQQWQIWMLKKKI